MNRQRRGPHRTSDAVTLTQIEDWALYSGLFAVLIIGVISPHVPLLDKLLKDSTVPFYLALLLLGRLLLKQMDHIRHAVEGLGRQGHFNEEIRELLAVRPRSRRIDILAFDSQKFFHAFEDVEFYTDHLRILLSESAKNIEEIRGQWESLRRKGRCRDLEILTYQQTPTFYTMIIDSEYGCLGFLDPGMLMIPQREDRLTVTGPYALNTQGTLGRAVLHDLQHWVNRLVELGALRQGSER